MVPKALLLLSFFSLSAMCGNLLAQNKEAVAGDTMPHVQRDTLIDLLMEGWVVQNKARMGMDGYRVQVYSGSGNTARQEANDIRRQIISTNPDLMAHLVYQPPNFKVRVGDCRTEVEAIQLKRKLAYHYPQGFVVRDLIRLPRLGIEQEGENPDGELPEGEVPMQDH